MISQVFILSSKGDHLIYKDCILGQKLLYYYTVSYVPVLNWIMSFYILYICYIIY